MSEIRRSERLAGKRPNYNDQRSDSEEGDQDSTRTFQDSDEESDNDSLDMLRPLVKITGTTTSSTNRPHFTTAPNVTAPNTTSTEPISKRNRYGSKNAARHKALNAQWTAQTGEPVPEGSYVQLRNKKLLLVSIPIRRKVGVEALMSDDDIVKLKALQRRLKEVERVKAKAEEIIAETKQKILKLTFSALEDDMDEEDMEDCDPHTMEIDWDLLDDIAEL